MESQRLPLQAEGNSLQRFIQRFSSGSASSRRTTKRVTAKPVVEKLEDRLALASIVTPHYTIPNFGDDATIVSDSSGDWSNPDTWSAGRVPTASDVVVISTGTSVTYDVASSPALESVVIDVGGLLNFRTDISTQLLVTNLQVLEGGELRVGTAADPVAASITVQIVIRNVALDTVGDPSQFGNGLIGLGKVTMYGAERVSAVRLAGEPHAGDMTITLETAATGWRVGDRLVFPDSKQWAIESYAYSPSYEDATIAAISADGRTITLAAPLVFDHPGARNGDGVVEFLPHVANRTRNVTVKSENSAGTRGHVLFTHRADVDVRYVGFVGTGRTTLGATDDTTYDALGQVTHVGTNQSDRHPVNFAHLYGPVGGQASGHQFTFIGNAVFCGLPTHNIKWGIAIEDSHYGLIQGNFLYNWAGAGLMTVSGNESFNVIERNIAIRGRGIGDREGSGNRGDEGSAFWFRGPNNYVRDNVGANFTNMSATGNSNGSEAAYGFKFNFAFVGDLRIPTFAGADTSHAGQYTVKFGNAMPLLEFARNEVYGTENGLSLWWLNAVDTAPQNGGESIVKDFRGWHIARYGFYGYPMNNVTFDGYVMRGDKSVLFNVHESVLGMWFGDYMTHNLIVRRADIQGMRTGIVDPYFSGSTSVIEDSYLRNNVNIAVRTPGAPGSGPNGLGRGPKSLIVRNVRYGSTDGWNLGGIATRNIAMGFTTHNDSANVIVNDTVHVYDYDGIAGLNYRVYYNEQRADFVVPQSSGNLVGSPVAGLTNQQNWNQYGIAIAGAVAPADATSIAEIQGLVKTFTVAPDTSAPAAPANLTATAVSTSQINLTWNASTDNVGVTGYRIYRSGVQIGTSSTTSFAATGLNPGTTYSFTVAAYDAAGNVSAASAPASATTHSPPPPDTSSPSTPTGLTATAVSTSQINLVWSASSDNVGVTGYRIFRNGTQVGTSITTSFVATGLTAGTTYTFTVVAYDAAGNVSGASAPASATTIAPPPSTTIIIDDGAAGSSLTGGWTRTMGRGYETDIDTAAKGNGSKQATWTFTGLASGDYNVWTTYTSSNKNATNAPYSLYNGSGVAPVIKVNQRSAPTMAADGAKWRFLGKVTVANGWMMVKLTNNANGIVVADAIRIVKFESAAPSASAVVDSESTSDSLDGSFLAFASAGIKLQKTTVPAPPLSKPAAQPRPSTAVSHAALDQFLSRNADVRPENAALDEVVSLLSETRGKTWTGAKADLLTEPFGP